MANPYRVLGIPAQAGDEAIRGAYLNLVRRYPPERHPEEFRRIRSAYEQVRHVRARLRFLLFSPGQGESFEEWMEEIQCERKREPLKLEQIRRLFRKM